MVVTSPKLTLMATLLVGHNYMIRLSCSLAVYFRKAFQQGTIGQHCVGPKISFTDEMFGSNLFLSDKIVDSRFCDCEDECLWDRWIRFVYTF